MTIPASAALGLRNTLRILTALCLVSGVLMLMNASGANAQDIDTSCIDQSDPDYDAFEVDSDGDNVVDARDPEGPCDPDINPYPCGGPAPAGPGGDPSYDPNFSDADGDGATDADEVAAGTNACPPDGANEVPGSTTSSTPDTTAPPTTAPPTTAPPTTAPPTTAPAAGPTVCGVVQAPTYDATTADTDVDGLTDAAETAAGLNPCVADSDADGLNDGQEVNVLGTSANNADTDGDGVADGAEVAANRNPLVAETIAFTGFRDTIALWGVALLALGGLCLLASFRLKVDPLAA
jgi:hypothetical protein